MAIAIKESKLGEYMVNLDTKDFGLIKKIKTVLSRQNKDTTWNKNVFASKLVSDFQFAKKCDRRTYSLAKNP